MLEREIPYFVMFSSLSALFGVSELDFNTAILSRMINKVYDSRRLPNDQNGFRFPSYPKTWQI